MTQQLPAETYEKIVALCRKYRIRELSLFGSRVRGDFTDESDFDFLVEFSPDANIDLFEFSRIQIDLEGMVDKKVDLVPTKGLKWVIRDTVLSEAEIIYAE